MPASPSASSGQSSGATPNTINSQNSTAAPLAAGATFTGEWVDATLYDSVVIAVKTDQNGSYSAQFSPDGVNVDSTLTRYYRTAQIDPPHRFTITRAYVRVVFTNTSASDQTYLRLQTTLGEKADLNAPLDSTLSQDFDSISVRPTDFKAEVSLGLRQGSALWNKFGYNEDVGTTAELLASWGGSYSPMTTARTLSIVSTSTDDASGGTGAQSLVVYGVDANRREQVVVVTPAGTTPVVTAETWLGINRIAVALAGSGKVNAGTITATATTDATIQGQLPAGSGTTQQCIFHVQEGSQALAEWITVNVARFGNGTEPIVTVKGWVYSAVSNAKYEVFRQLINTTFNGGVELTPPLPFPIGDGAVFWLEAVSTRTGTTVNGRFSLIEHRNVDAS
mgnify:CR=1 FL=1